jgi:hypothetical protein
MKGLDVDIALPQGYFPGDIYYPGFAVQKLARCQEQLRKNSRP